MRVGHTRTQAPCANLEERVLRRRRGLGRRRGRARRIVAALVDDWNHSTDGETQPSSVLRLNFAPPARNTNGSRQRRRKRKTKGAKGLSLSFNPHSAIP